MFSDNSTIKQNQDGMSLVAVLVAVAISGVLAVVISTLLKNGSDGQRSLELRSELDLIRRTLVGSLDCDATLSDAGIDLYTPGANCTSTTTNQTAPFLRLRRKTLNGSTKYLTGALDSSGAAALGGWKIRATCSASEQTLVIRAARISTGGNALSDPLTGVLQDWNSPKGVLFGGVPGKTPLCYRAHPSRSFGVPMTTLAALLGASCNGGGACFTNGCVDVVGNGGVPPVQVFNGLSGCTRWCASRGYAAGFITECDDGGTPAPGDDKVACGCVSQD